VFPTEQPHSDKKRSFRFRFRLRTFLIVVTIVSVWFGSRLKTARDQQDAVNAFSEITRIHSPARFRYAYEFDRFGNFIRQADPPGPNFLYRGLGQHFFARVVDLSLDGTRAVDSDLRHLSKLPRLRWVDLEYTSVTDSGLEDVIRRFPNLNRLDVQDTRVTSEGLKHVVALKHLRYLLFGQTPFSDNDFVHFSKLMRLEGISAPNAQLDGSGLRHLGTLTRLESLDLRDNPIQDANLAHLFKLTALKDLSLQRTEITDDGVQHLCQLSGLLELNIERTNVTDDGLKRLQAALPKCKIKR